MAKQVKDDSYRNFSNRKPYNDVPLREGEVLVPIAMSYRDLRYNRANMNNVETWYFRGHKVLVAFVPVQEEMFDPAMKSFNKQVSYILDPYTHIDAVSLDGMMEDQYDMDRRSYDPTGSTNQEELGLLIISLDDLIDYLASQGKEEMAAVLQLTKSDRPKSEIADQVFPHLKKSRAYERITEIQEEGKKLWNDKFRIK